MEENIESSDTKFTIIEAWKSSGLTQKEYCQQNNIGYHIFHYWYKKFKSSQKPKAGKFIPLQVKKDSSPQSSIEIILSNGTRIVFNKTVDATFIRALIH